MTIHMLNVQTRPDCRRLGRTHGRNSLRQSVFQDTTFWWVEFRLSRRLVKVRSNVGSSHEGVLLYARKLDFLTVREGAEGKGRGDLNALSHTVVMNAKEHVTQCRKRCPLRD